MNLYVIHYSDRYSDVTGTLRQKYTNEEAAKEAKHWHDTHPMPEDFGVSYWIEKVNVDEALDTFVPPMTQDQYDKLLDECYPNQDDCDDYPDDDYYPEPSEEELLKQEETQRLANELQEAEAKWKEEQERKNNELINAALELCKEILSEK